MPSYTVTWEINVVADSALDAARVAFGIVTNVDGETQVWSFEVTPERQYVPEGRLVHVTPDGAATMEE